MKVLFLCTGNSCRSQMAEGWARHLKGEVLEPYSAGIEKHGLNPHAVQVMSEAGVDLSKYYSKTLDDIGPVQFDFVVTVCGHANEHCPIFPGKRYEDWELNDPAGQTVEFVREVRDDIKQRVESLVASLEMASS